MPDARVALYSRQNPAVGRFLTGHFALLFLPCCLNNADGKAVYRNRHADQPNNLEDRLARCKRDILRESLAGYRWNRGRAAKALGISRVALFRKTRAQGLL